MTRLSRALVVLAGLVAAWALLPAGSQTAAVALVGVVVLSVAPSREWRRATTAGGGMLLGAILLAGWQGVSPQALVVATVGAVVAWDGAATAVGLERQLDADSESVRVETVHAGLALVATAGVGAVVTLAYLVGEGVVPTSAVLPVVVGAVLVAAGLGPRLAD